MPPRWFLAVQFCQRQLVFQRVQKLPKCIRPHNNKRFDLQTMSASQSDTSSENNTLSWYKRKCLEDPGFKAAYSAKAKARVEARKAQDPEGYRENAEKRYKRWVERYNNEEEFRAKAVQAARNYRAKKREQKEAEKTNFTYTCHRCKREHCCSSGAPFEEV